MFQGLLIPAVEIYDIAIIKTGEIIGARLNDVGAEQRCRAVQVTTANIKQGGKGI